MNKNEVVILESDISDEFEVTVRKHHDQKKESKTISDEFYIIKNIEEKETKKE